MNGFFYDSWIVILKFLIPGIFLGLVYDIFRFARISRNDYTHSIKKFSSDDKKGTTHFSEATMLFIEDTLFFIIVAITEILAFFYFNNGEIRICCLILSAVGFFAYQKTIGNLIIFFLKKTLHIIRKILYLVICMVLSPAIFFLGIFKKLFLKRYPKVEETQSNND